MTMQRDNGSVMMIRNIETIVRRKEHTSGHPGLLEATNNMLGYIDSYFIFSGVNIYIFRLT